MWKKLASLIAGSVLVSSCQTAMYKPIICEPGTALKGGRCQKVPQSIKDATRRPVIAPKAKPALKAKPVSIAAPAWTQPSAPKPTARQSEYGIVQ